MRIHAKTKKNKDNCKAYKNAIRRKTKRTYYLEVLVKYENDTKNICKLINEVNEATQNK